MTDKITVKAAAKVNLALDVTGRLENGYHSIESVFQTVGLYDIVSVELSEDGISVSCDVPEMFEQSDPIPCDERNIAFKAARNFFELTGIKGGCKIHITKGIPSQAGMGGGSTDAAAVIHCLNILYAFRGEEIDEDKVFEAGIKTGADVPFFLMGGGTAYVEGIGEKISLMADHSEKILVIAKGREGVSTAEAYRAVDSLSEPFHPETKKLVEAVNSDSENAFEFYGNLFEQAVNLPEIDEIKALMLENSALKAVMTGSGSAVFGLFETMEQAEICSEKLREKGFFAETCLTTASAFELVKP